MLMEVVNEIKLDNTEDISQGIEILQRFLETLFSWLDIWEKKQAHSSILQLKKFYTEWKTVTKAKCRKKTM